MRGLARPRWLVSILAIGCLLNLAGACKRKKHAPAQAEAVEVGDGSNISAADPRADSQFYKGFYPAENGSWRWTMQSFAVRLDPPRGSAEKGARLVLNFAVTDAVLKELKSLTLSAVVNGHAQPPETYSSAGKFTYARDIPADQLHADTIPVEFSLDKALPPGPVDRRELGVIVSSVGLEAK